jgi:histidyl-tRNA synthetase
LQLRQSTLLSAVVSTSNGVRVLSPQPRAKIDVLNTQKIVQTLQHTLSLYGYEAAETAVIEPADLFLTRAGDQLITRLFTFERYGKQLALRPEFTAAAAHRYAQQHDNRVVRWQFSGTIFEDDPDDFRHNYQRLSVGAELIGMSEFLADAEMLALAAHSAQSLNVGNWRLVIGHVGLTRQLLKRFGLDSRALRFLLHHLPALKDAQMGKTYVLEQLDRALLGKNHAQNGSDTDSMNEINTQQMLDVLLDATQSGTTMGGRTRHDIARRLLQKRQRVADRAQIVDALNFLDEWAQVAASAEAALPLLEQFVAPEDATARQLLLEWQKALLALDAHGFDSQHVLIQPTLARSWDYYTGMVFELRGDNDMLLAGGGRYDELVSLVAGGDQNVPAVGLAFYVDQWALLVEPAEDSHRAIMISINPDNWREATIWARLLRDQDIAVTLLPEGEVSDERVLTIDHDTIRLWNDTRYTAAQIDDLIANLSELSL